MYQQDWLMRQIAVFAQAIARVIFGKQTPVYEVRDDLNREHSDAIHQELTAMLREGRVNDAENLLFDSVNVNDINDLCVALDFYDRLNKWNNDDLEEHGFSREEIQEGLDEIMELFGASIW